MDGATRRVTGWFSWLGSSRFGPNGTAGMAARVPRRTFLRGPSRRTAVLGTGSAVRPAGQTGGPMVIEFGMGSSTGLRQVEEAGLACSLAACADLSVRSDPTLD